MSPSIAFPTRGDFMSAPIARLTPTSAPHSQSRVELPITNSAEGLNAAERALKKLNWPVERIADGTETSLYSERHRFSVMAVYVIHASLLLIFAGGIIDGFFGYSGYLMLQQGQTGNVIETRTGAKKVLPFSVKCYERRTGKLR